MHKQTKTTAIVLLCLVLAGCQTSVAPARIPEKPEDNTLRLSRHPEFQAAARVAPNLILETFETITRLETEKANRK
jgi:PBP1b-binding outer membrane lipoprotein LpoB